MPESLREALLPFVVARVVVLGALGLAHFIVDRTHPSTPGVAARVHAGLLGWDAGWYESIAREGYGPLGRQSLRFFPAVPLLTHALAWVPGLGDGPALVLLANAAALAATAMLYVLVRRETGDAAAARRSLWILSLLPAAFVLVMGYAESVLLVLAIGCFLALRPPPGDARPGRTSPWPALLAFAAALTGPIGVLLALAVAAELVRWWPRLGRDERVAGLARAGGPLRGRAGVPGLVRAQRRRLVGAAAGPAPELAPRGAVGPLSTLYHDATGVLHHHVGTALHVPWVLLALAMLDRVLAPAPGPLHPVRRRRPGHRRGRVQPRFVRALRPERLPAVDRRRARAHRVPARAGRPGAAGGRAGRLRPAGLLEHLGPLTADAATPPDGAGAAPVHEGGRGVH